VSSALEVAQKFADAVGFTRPTTLVANTSDDVRQLTELLNQAGRELASRHNWQMMCLEANFTTVGVENQGTLATIIGGAQTLKSIVNDTIWNRTTRLPVCGPLNQKIWAGYKALSLTGPYPQYRIRQNQILFNPVPTAGQSCYFEYNSKCWLTDSTGATFRRNLVADTDIFLIDDELLMAGLEWRWLRKKGMSYSEEFMSYEALVADAIVAEKPHATLAMDGASERYSAGIVVPIGSWPL
jgi:hypothetical protein